MMSNYNLINEDKYGEIKYLDELLRELQNETLNEDWGYWHFGLLNLKDGTDLAGRIYDALIEIPKYKDPYYIDTNGARRYNTGWDVNNMKLETILDLKKEIILQADRYALYQGPSTNKQNVSERFQSLKYEVADKLLQFLHSKEINEVKLVQGIDTCYSFGGDHCGDDILVDTKAGVYVIHFGFSS